MAGAKEIVMRIGLPSWDMHACRVGDFHFLLSPSYFKEKTCYTTHNFMKSINIKSKATLQIFYMGANLPILKNSIFFLHFLKMPEWLNENFICFFFSKYLVFLHVWFDLGIKK